MEFYSRDSNSVKNVDIDDESERYTTNSLNEEFDTELRHSNVVKTEVDT